MPQLRITRARGYLGKCHCSLRQRPVVRISVYFDRSQQEMQTTLLHEMIHLWQFQTGQRLSHGDSFKSMATLIARLSGGLYLITRCSKVDSALIESCERMRGPIVCDVLVWRGRRGICVARLADGRASELLSWFRLQHPDCTLYRGEGTVFRRFRSSRLRINYLTFAESDFEAEIAPCLHDL